MSTQPETVLCVKREALPKQWIEQKTVLPMAFSTFISQCVQSGFSFADRSKAEQDPCRKQIIPYIVLQTQHGDLTAVYCRNGSEARLHDRWSIGIGGHINPIDGLTAGNDTLADFERILTSAMQRELNEELTQRPENDHPQFMGIISEDRTAVGSVHLGAVFRMLTRTPNAYLPGEELYQFTWQPTHELATLNLELWSEMALALIKAHGPNDLAY